MSMKLIHVALYAKGHYKRTDIWEDLKQCLRAHDYMPDTKEDVMGILMARLNELVLKQYHSPEHSMTELLKDIDPQNTWKCGYYTTSTPWKAYPNDGLLPEYDYKEAVVRAYLSRLVSMTREELEWTDDMNIAADPNVLPLKQDKVTEENQQQ